ncbi:hypothetical protein BKA67DRAFT_527061 [Truncatella angustata]|uniref:Uncharacterized protein n=1 Tax=Truncatella angustata TaxID=152316 RepID=A0A9P8RLT1_9PEZI|nr:uncharacterized protein BKA67DRAFT_527061 [Truncatella angustata]KAH6645690.1 hypothetical protein BKA67DRAFT_527061 [Truncatella angustata]
MGVSFLWKLVYDALTTDHFHFPTSSSAQGFLTVTICRHIVEGKLQELWRLHVWLPGGDPGHEGFSIHKHNAFGQSRFVAGQGTNHVWSIEEDAKAEQKEDTQKGDLIPLSKYRLEWTDTNGSSTAYKTNQTSSTVINTGKLVVARRLESTSHSSGMCYTIGEDEYHSSAVSKDRISATLFVFNSSRGHNNDEETIIGPRDQEKSTFVRCVADKTAKELCILVEKAIDQERCEPVMNKW